VEPKELREWRESVGVTQAVAAAIAGVSVNTWARWEQGRIAPHPLRVASLRATLEKYEREAYG
jgi:DNA-binding transcriptional regulator YiaG